MNAKVYKDSLELFFKRGLRDYVKKNTNYTLVENRKEGDVILDVKCRFVEQVEKMSGLKLLYFPDNLDRFGELFERYEWHYDFIFFAHENDKIDNKRYFHLPVAYDPDTHYQHKKDDTIYPLTKKHTVDVAFVGTKHEGRGFLTKVPNISIRGNGWGNTIFPVYGALKAKLYSKTKIMINHHVAGDTSPNMRTFEGLAMGTFLLSDLVPEYLYGGMAKYTSFDDLLTKIDYYLEHEEEREAIAVKGKELVKPYTYEARMAQMLEVILK
jgi:spore maturation protein CgeB